MPLCLPTQKTQMYRRCHCIGWCVWEREEAFHKWCIITTATIVPIIIFHSCPCVLSPSPLVPLYIVCKQSMVCGGILQKQDSMLAFLRSKIMMKHNHTTTAPPKTPNKAITLTYSLSRDYTYFVVCFSVVFREREPLPLHEKEYSR